MPFHDQTYRFHLEGAEHQRNIEKYSSTSSITQLNYQDGNTKFNSNTTSMEHRLQSDTKYNDSISEFGCKTEQSGSFIKNSIKDEDKEPPIKKALFSLPCDVEKPPPIPSLLEIQTFKPLENRTEPVFDDTLVLLDPCKYLRLYGPA